MSRARAAPVRGDSAYQTIYGYTDASVHTPHHTVSTPFALDFNPETVERSESRGRRRPTRMTLEEAAAVGRKVESKLLSPTQARAKHYGGSVKGLLAHTPDDAAFSGGTGRGVRVKGTTPDEIASYTARVDAAVAAHKHRWEDEVGNRHVPAFVQNVEEYAGPTEPRQRSLPPGRRTKGMSSDEVRSAWDKRPQPSVSDIKAKMVTGNWSGPAALSFPDAPKAHHDLSYSQEVSLRVAEASGVPATVSTLRERQSPSTKAAWQSQYEATVPTGRASANRSNMMDSHWSFSGRDVERVDAPRPPALKVTGAITAYVRLTVV